MALQQANQAFLRIPSRPENASKQSYVPSNDPPSRSAIGHLGQVIHVPDSRYSVVAISVVEVLEVGVYCRLQRASSMSDTIYDEYDNVNSRRREDEGATKGQRARQRQVGTVPSAGANERRGLAPKLDPSMAGIRWHELPLIPGRTYAGSAAICSKEMNR